MTIYTTDFSEYTLGVNLSDWTDFWGIGAFTYQAQANAGTFKVGTKECVYNVSSSARAALTWDDVGSVNDSDIIIKVSANTLAINGIRVYSRVGGSPGSENGYFAELRDQFFRINKYDSGASTSILAKTFAPKSNTNYWIRFQTSGTTLRAKIWAETALEPAEWKISVSDSFLLSGYVGFGGFDGTVDFEVDYFSCGTAGGSAIFPPTGYDLITDFGYVGDTDLSTALTNICRAMGGLFDSSNKRLNGVRIIHDGHTNDIRVGVYSGGDLSTGLNNATLLHDFGKVTGSTSPLELSCPPVNIPNGNPLWLVIKFDGVGFTAGYTADVINSGNYQITQGRCELTAIIGSEADTAFPATFADTNGSFGSFWYDWNILFEEEETETLINLDSGTYNLTGSDINLQELQLTLEAGNYSLSGSDIDLLKDYSITLAPGNYNIVGTFIDFSYLKELETGWKSAKGSGPWDFTEQPNKWGYLNNPFWTDEPQQAINYTGKEEEEPQIWSIDKNPSSAPGTQHTPCGHWHKRIVSSSMVQANIYIRYINNNDAIKGVFFNGYTLSTTALYQPGENLQGLNFYDNNLVSIENTSADATLKYISTQSIIDNEFQLIHTYDSLLPYDAQASVSTRITLAENPNDFYFTNRSGIIVKFSDLVKVNRGFCGASIVGSDSNHYKTKIYGGFFPDTERPITGSWSDWWELIDDITTVGIKPFTTTDTLYACVADTSTCQIKGNYMYYARYITSVHSISKIDLNNDYEVVVAQAPAEIRRIYLYENYVYCMTQTFSTTILKLRQEDLTTELSQPNIEGVFGDIIEVGGYIIVVTVAYLTQGAYLYKLNASDLSIVDSLLLGTTGDDPLYQRLAKIDDQFVAAARNTGVSVFDIENMSIIDDLDLLTFGLSTSSAEDIIVSPI